MFYALSWFVVFSLLALWSLAAWAFHAVAVWAWSNSTALAGAATGAVSTTEGLWIPAWLAPWLPQEAVQAMSAMLLGLAPAVQGLLQATPSLVGGLGVATWVIWGLGSMLLVLLGVVCTCSLQFGAVAMAGRTRRRARLRRLEHLFIRFSGALALITQNRPLNHGHARRNGAQAGCHKPAAHPPLQVLANVPVSGNSMRTRAPALTTKGTFA